jgi:predicted GH43/DUF377 family glycosyl hydrolase
MNQLRAVHRLQAAAIVAFILIGAARAADPTDAEIRRWLAPQDWRRDTDGPVLSLGAAGSFDSEHIHAPAVVLENGKYRMWYVGSEGKVADRVFKLGLAESDDGRNFRRHEGPVLAFADGRHSVLTPSILATTDGKPIRENGKLRIWFSSTDFQDQSGLHTLHEATSTDGITWSEPSPAEIKHCYAPTVIKEGDAYLLWYTDVEKEWLIRHARSRDGKNWEVDSEPVMRLEKTWDTGRLFYPTVVKADGLYVMWYGAYWKGKPEAKTALGVAISRDGRKWTRSPDNPVLRPDESRSWESHYTTSQSVMRLADGSWRIWYASRPKPPFSHKYFALCTAVWAGPTNDKAP